MSPKNKKKNEPVKPSRVIGYIRVSTTQQVVEGHSLEAQQANLRKYADAFGLEIVAFEVDAGLSAGTLERPALQRALARLEAGEAEGLLVTKLDRLTRSVRDLLDLVDTYFRDGYCLVSVGEQIDTRSPAGRMILTVLSAMAQLEREQISERTSAVMQYMKAEGMFTGGFPPFGFNVVDGKLVEVWDEQRSLAHVRALHTGGKSIRAIAASTVNPRTGRTFHPTQIARML